MPIYFILQEIIYFFEEIEDMALAYKEMDEYSTIVIGILFELLLSYRQLDIKSNLPAEKTGITRRILRVQFHLCTLFYRQVSICH